MFTPLCFSRNRCTEVEQVDDQTIRSACHLQDTLTDAFVEVEVRLPDLEIASVKGEVRRSYKKECLNLRQILTGFRNRSVSLKSGKRFFYRGENRCQCRRIQSIVNRVFVTSKT